MTIENKRFLKFWAKNFGSFLAWVVGGSLIGITFTYMPIWAIPYALVVLLLGFGAHMSFHFAKSDYSLDEMKQRRVMDALSREQRD